MATIKKACKGAIYPKSSSVSRRLKTGGGFPDLNKDGKITKKDVLIGRGVLSKTAKKGMKVKKAQDGIIKKQKSDSTRYDNKYQMQIDKFKKSKEYKDYQDKVSKFKKEHPGEPIVIPGTIQKTPKQKMGGKTKKCAYGCK